jgi:hypothetical protein
VIPSRSETAMPMVFEPTSRPKTREVDELVDDTEGIIASR